MPEYVRQSGEAEAKILVCAILFGKSFSELAVESCTAMVRFYDGAKRNARKGVTHLSLRCIIKRRKAKWLQVKRSESN